MTFSYSSRKLPHGYVCSECGATGCKLWREYNTSEPRLLCCECAAKDQGKNIDSIDGNGVRQTSMGSTDQIGYYVPAVPTEGEIEEVYWGCSAVPDRGIAWWRLLLTLPQR